MSKLISAIFFPIIFICFFQTSAFAQEPREIVIGLIPEMNVFSQMKRFRPLADYLSEETGIPVRLKILRRYGNIIDSFTRDKMDGAFFGSFTGALAIQKLKVVPLARPVNPNGRSTYCGYIYARTDSGIRSAHDMRGKKFAFVEKATTAGYIFPLAYLKSNGISDKEKFFSEQFYSGSHDASLYAVLNGKADAGASKDTVFELIRRKDPRIDREIVILAKSSHVPSNGLCVRSDLPESLQNKIKEALLNFDQKPGGKEILEKFGALEFIPTTVEDYLPVFELAEKAGVDLKHYEYNNE